MINSKVIFSTGLSLLVAPYALHAKEKVESTRPNIVLILLDDVGYSDYGCYGSEIQTPNIDNLAQHGLRFSHFYNMARSSPTRASLITGLYPHQAGQGALNRVDGYPAYQGYLNSQCVTIPEVLHSAGYFNVMTGKWHLGQDRGATPITRGFDRSFNSPVGGFYYADGKQNKGNRRLFLNDKQILFNDTTHLPKGWYTTHLWVDYGLKFTDEAISKQQPFFWYLAFNGAHFPVQAPEKTIQKYRGKYLAGWDSIRNARFKKQIQLGLFPKDTELTPRNPKIKKWETLNQQEKAQYDHQMAIYAAAIDEIDQGIGRVVDHLREKGVLDNTIIIILNDNGGNAEGGLYGRYEGDNPGGPGSTVFVGTDWADVENTPFFLYKHHGHEGGCNTPLIVYYPKGISKNLVGTIDQQNYGHVSDILPTIAQIAGATYPSTFKGHAIIPTEGTSLLPALQGKKIKRNKPIIVEHEGNKMLRDGDYKIVQEAPETHWNLYNIKKDPTEMHDIASQKPELLKKLISEYQAEAKRTGVVPEIKWGIGGWYTPVEDYIKNK